MPRLHNDEQNQHFLLFPQSLKEQKSIKLRTVCMDKTDVEANVTETNVTETNVTEANVTETNMTGQCDRGQCDRGQYDRPKCLKLVVVAFPLATQDYENSTTTGPPVSG